MTKLKSLAALFAAWAALALAAPAVAAPVTVNVRVEGATQTIFEGPVTTDVHRVDNGDGTGDHQCDGLNADASKYPAPGPTVTGAFDDASKLKPFSWSGAFTNDFFVRQIAGEHDTSSTFWNFVRNWNGLTVGGCQEQVQQGDTVLIALTGFDPVTYAGWPMLDLRGAPASAAVNQPFTVHVFQHDGTGSAATDAAGATVGGVTTGSDGTATISFDTPGVKTLKAERSNSIRSNGASVCVYTPGSGDCGTDRAPGDTTPTPGIPTPALKDTTPPVISVTSLTNGKTYRKGPRVLSGQVDEAGGIAQVFLRVRATDGGNLTSASRCRWFSGKRGVFTHRTVPCSRARFFRIGTNAKFSYLLPSRLGKGSYVVDVKVLDRAYNAGRSAVRFRVK
jgi:phage-related protein